MPCRPSRIAGLGKVHGLAEHTDHLGLLGLRQIHLLAGQHHRADHRHEQDHARDLQPHRVGRDQREARAAREIIVSAGSINSPQLLELSGIGQGDRLAGLGIKVWHELAGVGEAGFERSIGAGNSRPKCQHHRADA